MESPRRTCFVSGFSHGVKWKNPHKYWNRKTKQTCSTPQELLRESYLEIWTWALSKRSFIWGNHWGNHQTIFDIHQVGKVAHGHFGAEQTTDQTASGSNRTSGVRGKCYEHAEHAHNSSVSAKLDDRNTSATISLLERATSIGDLCGLVQPSNKRKTTPSDHQGQPILPTSPSSWASAPYLIEPWTICIVDV